MKNWFYYIIPFIIVVIIFYFFRWRTNRSRFENIDYTAEGKNVALSITKCKALHRQLVKAIHPDRLQESQRQIADQLMQSINTSKYDYRQLTILKKEVELFLNKKL